MNRFNRREFATILSKISYEYGSISEFARKANLGRSYISKYINLKIPHPPSIKILTKIAENSKGITTYGELLKLCGYIKPAQKELWRTWKVLESKPILIDRSGLIRSELLVCDKGRILVDYKPPYKKQVKEK